MWGKVASSAPHMDVHREGIPHTQHQEKKAKRLKEQGVLGKGKKFSLLLTSIMNDQAGIRFVKAR